MKIREGQKYIVRSVEAGVFYGEIISKDGAEVEMKNARCLWYYSGAASLNQLALEGVKRPKNCQFTVPIEELIIMNVCEILPCTEQAVESIDAVEPWRA